MRQVVSITSQGQLTIPKSMRDAFGINRSTKAVIIKQGNTMIVTPKRDFWSLKGALKSKVKLSDKQLREAREAFGKQRLGKRY